MISSAKGHVISCHPAVGSWCNMAMWTDQPERTSVHLSAVLTGMPAPTHTKLHLLTSRPPDPHLVQAAMLEWMRRLLSAHAQTSTAFWMLLTMPRLSQLPSQPLHSQAHQTSLHQQQLPHQLLLHLQLLLSQISQTSQTLISEH